jgi:hypothetical protein
MKVPSRQRRPRLAAKRASWLAAFLAADVQNGTASVGPGTSIDVPAVHANPGGVEGLAA